MDIKLSIAETLGEAQALAPAIDRYATEVSAEFRDQPPAQGLGERLLARNFDSPETVVVIARSRQDDIVGMCVTIPFEDPLFGDTVPFAAVLFVDPDCRHRGLAGHIMQAAQETLTSRGIHKLAVRAGHNDDALISMGERWGFVREWEWMVRE